MQVKAYHDYEEKKKGSSVQVTGDIESVIKNTKNGTISLSVKDGQVVRVERFEQYRW